MSFLMQAAGAIAIATRIFVASSSLSSPPRQLCKAKTRSRRTWRRSSSWPCNNRESGGRRSEGPSPLCDRVDSRGRCRQRSSRESRSTAAHSRTTRGKGRRALGRGLWLAFRGRLCSRFPRSSAPKAGPRNTCSSGKNPGPSAQQTRRSSQTQSAPASIAAAAARRG